MIQGSQPQPAVAPEPRWRAARRAMVVVSGYQFLLVSEPSSILSAYRDAEKAALEKMNAWHATGSSRFELEQRR